MKVYLYLLCICIIATNCSKENSESQQNNGVKKEISLTEKEQKKLNENEALIEEVVSKKIKENLFELKTNLAASVRKIELKPLPNGKRNLFVEYADSSKMGKKIRDNNILVTMSGLYFHFYHASDLNVDLNSITISAFYPVMDKYGNDEYKLIYKTSLNNKEADKINWQNDDIDLKTKIIPKVWSVHESNLELYN